METVNKIYLPDIVGKGYATFWKSKCRYVIVKGSRASKKSKTAALWHIYHMMKYPLANTLVIRKTERTLKDSCYADLRWAIDRLGVSHLWQVKQSPLELIYKPTGQKILFRGLDDPLKITSISVTVGVLCWVWFEELYEILTEEDFNYVDESVRGYMPEGYFKRITGTMNPWSDQHWVKRRFFDVKDENILALTTNYLCNEWLDEADLKLFEEMKKNRPKRYDVAGLGNWGVTEGIIFENWEVQDLSSMIPSFSNIYNGLDFGFSSDPNAFIRFDIEHAQKKIYIFQELYKTGMQNDELSETLHKVMGPYEYVTCDSADPRSIDYLNRHGIRAIPAVKGPDSIVFGIDWLLQYDIVIHKDCGHFIEEIANYQWDKDKFGQTLKKPVDRNNHLIDALRYGSEPLQFNSVATATKRI